MSWVDRLDSSDVNSPETWASYAQQRAGIPYPTKQNMGRLKRLVKEFFAEYPQANYQTLCTLVEWAKIKKRRYACPSRLLTGGFRFAYEDGYLPELDPENRPDSLTNLVGQALRVEEDGEWRRLLMITTGTAQEKVYQTWLDRRGFLLTSSPS